jgi:hypothetical protein
MRLRSLFPWLWCCTPIGCGVEAQVLGEAHGTELLLDAGSGSVGEDGSPDETMPDQGIAVALAVGSTHACAIRRGSLSCWGQALGEKEGVVAPPTTVGTKGYASVCSGNAFTCAIEFASSDAVCWGQNIFGQLGVGDVDARKTPARVSLPGKPVSLRCGGDSACAILIDGSLWCWGRNDQHQLGYEGNGSPVPVRVGESNDWQSVTVGASTTCGIRRGSLYCWGRNDLGQTGVGSAAPIIVVPTLVGGGASTWAGVGVGSEDACGFHYDRTFFCWGQLYSGNSPLPVQREPKAIFGSTTGWIDIALGLASRCGRLDPGALVCWGRNDQGQVGIENGGTLVPEPLPIGNDTDWAAVGVGNAFLCVQKAPGTVFCAGSNTVGQLGAGPTGPGAHRALLAEVPLP